MVELKLFLMPPLKRSGRVKAFLENTTRRVEIFQKSRLGLDSSLEGRFIILHQKSVGFDHLEICWLYFSCTLYLAELRLYTNDQMLGIGDSKVIELVFQKRNMRLCQTLERFFFKIPL